jgi:ectoine hydroxylase-related dioxygenase (phytanoyl-CoA dioxygenase family)
MQTFHDIKEKVLKDGFAITNKIYTDIEVELLLDTISAADSTKPAFRKSNDLFAIRQFFKEIPEAAAIVFNSSLNLLIKETFGADFFLVKAIYFDKPEKSNWFVSYHQDLTISVDKRIDLDGFGPWTTKQNQFAVQPPLAILEDKFTIRIHLDKTTEENGALKVIPGSHRKGLYRPETINWEKETEYNCTIEGGSAMIMKPLLLHSSGRTTNNSKRRVLHLEFSRSSLPASLNWSERLNN